jgi:hypothetical protein
VARDRLKVAEEAIRLGDKLVGEHPEALALLGRRRFLQRQARRWVRLAAARARAGDRSGAEAAIARAREMGGAGLVDRMRTLWWSLRIRG